MERCCSIIDVFRTHLLGDVLKGGVFRKRTRWNFALPSPNDKMIERNPSGRPKAEIEDLFWGRVSSQKPKQKPRAFKNIGPKNASNC